jgi:hypothetical protein
MVGRKIIVTSLIAIIIGAITATTAASPWKFAVLADIGAEAYSAYDSDVASNTLEFLVRDIKNQGVDLVISPVIGLLAAIISGIIRNS